MGFLKRKKKRKQARKAREKERRKGGREEERQGGMSMLFSKMLISLKLGEGHFRNKI